MSAERPDVLAAAEPFVQQCGPCDFGVMTMGCACPPGDYRPVMFRLVQEVERLRAANVALAADLAAARARTQETAGRCGDVAPSLSLLTSRIRPTCRLTAGHAGWHRGDDDSEWTMTQETNR